jgi:hypothetical protein
MQDYAKTCKVLKINYLRPESSASAISPQARDLLPRHRGEEDYARFPIPGKEKWSCPCRCEVDSTARQVPDKMFRAMGEETVADVKGLFLVLVARRAGGAAEGVAKEGFFLEDG